MLLALTIAACMALGDGDKPRLCVIAPHGWRATLEPFAAARAREFEVEVAALEDVVASKEGVDAPERIKRWLYRAWSERNARYVLLVGDADTFPVRFMVLDRWTPEAFNYAFYPCDLYYADVADSKRAFDDWNHAKDGFHARYFGEVRGESNKTDPIDYDGVSYVPELALGRWPVSDERQLAAVIAKTLAWTPSAAEPRAYLVHPDGWVDARERVRALEASLKAAHFQVEADIYGDSTSSPTPERTCAALNSRLDLAIHFGHGSRDSWAGLFGLGDLDAVRSSHPAVLMSIGCNTAELCTEPPYWSYVDELGIQHRGTTEGERFDQPPTPPACLQPGRYNWNGLGEELLRMPSGGAVAYIGCDTGAQPCALTLADGFVGALAANRNARVGDAWRDALAHYWSAEKLAELNPNDDWYPPSIFFQGMKFMLFGDPTLSLATATEKH